MAGLPFEVRGFHRYILITDCEHSRMYYACIDCGFVDPLEGSLVIPFREMVACFPEYCALVGEVVIHGH